MESEKKSITFHNRQLSQIGLEIYYEDEDEIMCDGHLVEKECVEKFDMRSSIYQIIIFYLGRFHYISQDLLNKRIKKIAFPFCSILLEYDDGLTMSLY